MSANSIMQALKNHRSAARTGMGIVCECGEFIGPNDEDTEDALYSHVHELVEQIVSEIQRDARIQALSDAARDIDLQVDRRQADIQDSYTATMAAEVWLAERAEAEM